MTEETKTPDASAQNALAAKPAVLRATIEIIRAGTGKKETFELIGTVSDSPPAETKESTS